MKSLKLLFMSLIIVAATISPHNDVEATILEITWTGQIESYDSSNQAYSHLNIGDPVSFAVRVDDASDSIIGRGIYEGEQLLTTSHSSLTLDNQSIQLSTNLIDTHLFDNLDDVWENQTQIIDHYPYEMCDFSRFDLVVEGEDEESGVFNIVIGIIGLIQFDENYENIRYETWGSGAIYINWQRQIDFNECNVSIMEVGTIPELPTVLLFGTAGDNGSISPTGAVSVDYGTDQIFTISPDANYHVSNVVVDGSSVGAVASYTFTHVSNDHSINATFAIDTYTLTYLAGANGSIIDSNQQLIKHGFDGNQVIAIPANNYRFVNWSDGSTTNPRTDVNIVADITVTAMFAEKLFWPMFMPAMSGTSEIDLEIIKKQR